MSGSLRSVCLVTGGFTARNLRLQPWRYLSEVAKGLCEQGHHVTVVSDAADLSATSENGLEVRHISSVASPAWKPNQELMQAVLGTQADVILWHVGLASFLYQSFPLPGEKRCTGIFTSPIYELDDLHRVGLPRLLKNASLSAVHLASTLAPRWWLRKRMRGSAIKHLVVQTETLRRQLYDGGLWGGPIDVIAPGVDPLCSSTPDSDRQAVRAHLGYSAADRVVVYFGSPAPLRGLPWLIEAFTIARQREPFLKLLVLSRRRAGELDADRAALDRLVQASPVGQHIRVIDGFMDQEELTGTLTACDAAALPFELVPSDAPLSLLEASALGLPVITTRLACLPELVPDEQRFLAEPANAASLAEQVVKAVRAPRAGRAPVPSPRGWQQVGKEWSDLVQVLQ